MKKLIRTQNDRKIAGVCGGVAKYFNLDPTVVRILTVVLFILTTGWPIFLAYLISIFVVPNEEDVAE
ncbi:PspC domain-containing protein [Bacillus sp. FJAT-45037]|uniref:PspC domain-containing protein n=1 Tax=Bacillus sp. FJAT-45037 TaxID=2011007 RepID=UPI000C24C5C6|nr:PspC domain-containing protein [Bacillus sp. FJAT-45037]